MEAKAWMEGLTHAVSFEAAACFTDAVDVFDFFCDLGSHI
jgi:hypothetical protein